MILLWGSRSDAPLRDVRAVLHKRGTAHMLIDNDAVPAPHLLSEELAKPGGVLFAEGARADMDAVTAIYVRPQEHAIGELDRFLSDWTEVETKVIAVNRPSAMAANACKPLQLRWIERHGFAVPETLLTTSAEAARAFQRHHGTIIYKSISGVRSIVSRLEPDRDLSDLRNCPTQFQQFIAGTDYRVHAIAGGLFTTRIESDAEDYRYARQAPPVLSPDALPQDVARRVLAMVGDMGLLAAGADLRRTPDGTWYCFEVNPSPGFSYYAAATGQPIAEAIADVLSARVV